MYCEGSENKERSETPRIKQLIIRILDTDEELKNNELQYIKRSERSG